MKSGDVELETPRSASETCRAAGKQVELVFVQPIRSSYNITAAKLSSLSCVALLESCGNLSLKADALCFCSYRHFQILAYSAKATPKWHLVLDVVLYAVVVQGLLLLCSMA